MSKPCFEEKLLKVASDRLKYLPDALESLRRELLYRSIAEVTSWERQRISFEFQRIHFLSVGRGADALALNQFERRLLKEIVDSWYRGYEVKFRGANKPLEPISPTGYPNIIQTTEMEDLDLNEDVSMRSLDPGLDDPRMSGLKRKNESLAKARIASEQIAKKRWEEDMDKEIRISNMAELVREELAATEHRHFCPQLETVKTWIRQAAPDYARKRGRPPKRK